MVTNDAWWNILFYKRCMTKIYFCLHTMHDEIFFFTNDAWRRYTIYSQSISHHITWNFLEAYHIIFICRVSAHTSMELSRIIIIHLATSYYILEHCRSPGTIFCQKRLEVGVIGWKMALCFLTLFREGYFIPLHVFYKNLGSGLALQFLKISPVFRSKSFLRES